MGFDFDYGSSLNGMDYNNDMFAGDFNSGSDFGTGQDFGTGFTSIYDHRAIVGLPDWMEGNENGWFDPLNTGNAATDLVNAIALLGNGEISPTQLAVSNPAVYGGLLDFALTEFADMFGPAADEQTYGDCVADNIGQNILTSMAAGAILGAGTGAVSGSLVAGVGAGPGAAMGATTGAITGVAGGAVGTLLDCWWFGP